MPDTNLLHCVFDALSECVLFFAGGAPLYRNPAAAALAVEDSALMALASGETLSLDGRVWTAEVTAWDGGTLVVLRPAAEDGLLERRLPLLLEDLRRQVNNLTAVSHLITPLVREHSAGRYDDYLAIMDQSFYRLLRLIQNAELAGDMAEGKVSFHPQPMDLAGFCAGLWRRVEPLAALAGTAFSYESELDALLTTGDELLLRRLLLELISNALRGAGEGGRAGLRLARSGDRALLIVWNSGGSVDLSALTEEGLAPAPEGGLRLGLTTARYLSALHGGAVMLESREGKGTQATVSLPIRPPAPGAVHTPKRADADGGFSPILTALSGVLPYEAFRGEGE